MDVSAPVNTRAYDEGRSLEIEDVLEVIQRMQGVGGSLGRSPQVLPLRTIVMRQEVFDSLAERSLLSHVSMVRPGDSTMVIVPVPVFLGMEVQLTEAAPLMVDEYRVAVTAIVHHGDYHRGSLPEEVGAEIVRDFHHLADGSMHFGHGLVGFVLSDEKPAAQESRGLSWVSVALAVLIVCAAVLALAFFLLTAS